MGGGGASRFDTPSFTYPADATPQSFSHTYPAAEGVLRLRYASPNEQRLSVFLGAGARVTFAKANDTQTLANLNPGVLQPFGKAVSVPMLAGLSVRI